MIQFLARRAGFYLLAAWVALSFNFFIPRLMPGDATTSLLGLFLRSRIAVV